MMKSTLAVAAIKNGTVIDHIEEACGLKIIHLLKLAQQKRRLTIGLNLTSKLLSFKDIIKIEDYFLSTAELSQVAIISSQATVNIIEDYEVVNKFSVQIPDVVEQLFSCPNPHCISNNEQARRGFCTELRKEQVFLRCRFCEKCFCQGELLEFL